MDSFEEGLRELLRDLEAAAQKNFVWSAEDLDADFRQYSLGYAEACEYVVVRVLEILG